MQQQHKRQQPQTRERHNAHVLQWSRDIMPENSAGAISHSAVLYKKGTAISSPPLALGCRALCIDG